MSADVTFVIDKPRDDWLARKQPITRQLATLEPKQTHQPFKDECSHSGSQHADSAAMKKITTTATLFFCLGLTAGAYAQSAGDDIKKAGTETKDATKDAARGSAKAAKTGARKTKNGVKKGAHATASGVKKVADKAEDKTQ